MEKFVKIKPLGQGSYGVVFAALNTVTDELVAIKKMKYTSKEDCTNLREVMALLQLMNNPNIVKLKEFIKEGNSLYLVFELMECSLQQRLRMNNIKVTHFFESEIRNMCFQVFQGLAHMHANGYFHRDLKPDNLLLSKDVIKIADLGMARETNRKGPYTGYVTTRGYRAPEVFLRCRVQDPAVDMWAMGAIMAELFTNMPLFGGDSEGEVLNRICYVIGSPTESTWSEGIQLAYDMNYEFPKFPGKPFAALLPYASNEALCLIATLLSWNPSMRPTAVEALEHPFFDSCCVRLRSTSTETDHGSRRWLNAK